MLPRFYYPEILKGNNQISNKTHVHHICKVLRLKKNDYIQLFDGAGNHAKAKIIEVKKQIIELNVESVNKPLLIQNSKITFKTLNHILQDTKYDKDNLCDFSHRELQSHRRRC